MTEMEFVGDGVPVKKPKRFALPNLTPWDWLHILGLVLILGAILGVNYGDAGLAISGIPLGSLLLYAYIKRRMAQPRKAQGILVRTSKAPETKTPEKKEPEWEQ